MIDKFFIAVGDKWEVSWDQAEAWKWFKALKKNNPNKTAEIWRRRDNVWEKLS